MGQWKELMKDLDGDKKFYSKNYLSEKDELLFEMTYVTEKLSLASILFIIISILLTGGVFGPREHQYIIGVGKLKIYILYLGKHDTIPSIDDAKPKYVKITSLDAIKEISIKKTFLFLFYKITIFLQEENKTFYVGFAEKKSHIEYMKNLSKLK